jgi:nucleotide-binding universal stress UspA family protein
VEQFAELASRTIFQQEAQMISDLKKILAPIDFSEFSMEALQVAWRIAQKENAELHIAHAVAPHFAIIRGARELARETLMAEEAEEHLAQIKRDTFGNSPKVITYVTVGQPAQKLADYVRQEHMDLVVLAARGRSAADGLGGLTERIARIAPCSVLISRHRSH